MQELYAKAWELINKSQSIVLIPHINPDADGIGSAIGTYIALKNLGKQATLFCVSKEMPKVLDFLKGYEKFKHELPKKMDLVISFDCARFDRLGIIKGDFKLINIDHHISNEHYGDVNIIDTNACSTTIVVYKLLKSNNIALNRDIADALYTGLVEDTNFFSNDDINIEAFEIATLLIKEGCNPAYVAKMLTKREPLSKIRLEAELLNTLELHFDAKVSTIYLTQEMLKKSGATLSDTDEFANIGKRLATVEIALFFREIESSKIRVSVRSKESFDSNAFAKLFGGGGHVKAAGFILENTNLWDAKEKILQKIGEMIT